MPAVSGLFARIACLPRVCSRFFDFAKGSIFHRYSRQSRASKVRRPGPSTLSLYLGVSRESSPARGLTCQESGFGGGSVTPTLEASKHGFSLQRAVKAVWRFEGDDPHPTVRYINRRTHMHTPWSRLYDHLWNSRHSRAQNLTTSSTPNAAPKITGARKAPHRCESVLRRGIHKP